MLSGGVEGMIGIAQDPVFGPLIAFGLGGTHVEIINDVCFRVTPISDRDAGDMVQGIRGYRLLQGFRGRPAISRRLKVCCCEFPVWSRNCRRSSSWI